MIRDRASVVATTLIAIMLNRLRDPATHDEIAAALRDELKDNSSACETEDAYYIDEELQRGQHED